MKTPAVPIAVLALLLGCQTEQQSPPAGASPAAGTAGAATGGGGSGGGTPNTGGASGSAGADAGGSASYSAPEWAALGDVASCTVFRIANPELVKPVLSWSSCGDGCKDSAQIHHRRWTILCPQFAQPYTAPVVGICTGNEDTVLCGGH